ncbi:hypothetical protein [Anabaena lutea]|uniref:hypothetical protein n=1 Tax=Anabaena lutea TaxID=212350 RepID=UPI00168497DF|nr:hypothetical protein [Anabaena lutea]
MSNLLATQFVLGHLLNVRLLIKSSDANAVGSYGLLKIAARNTRVWVKHIAESI